MEHFHRRQLQVAVQVFDLAAMITFHDIDQVGPGQVLFGELSVTFWTEACGADGKAVIIFEKMFCCAAALFISSRIPPVYWVCHSLFHKHIKSGATFQIVSRMVVQHR